jgi:hypothetical protein
MGLIGVWVHGCVHLLVQAGLAYRGPDVLGQTFAAALLQNGENALYVDI